MSRFWSVWRLHGQIGTGLLVWVVWMVASGVLMNHAVDLGLTEAPVSHALQTPAQTPPQSDQLSGYLLAGHYISQIDNKVYWDAEPLGACEQPLVGVAAAAVLVAACGDQLLLLSPAGELIEQLPWTIGAGAITGVAEVTGGLVVATTTGSYRADAQLIEFNPLEQSLRLSNSAVELPPELRQAVFRAANRISWFRWLVDLHTGRIAGPYGPYLVDLLGILLVVVSVTGYLLRRRRGHVTKRAHKR